MFAFLEGDRTFELAYGIATGGLCLALAVPLLVWSLPARRWAFFGDAIDPRGRLQTAYGIFCVAMACTDVACRAIPHGPLAYVHPAFFAMTLLLVFALGPRLWSLARTPPGRAQGTTAPSHGPPPRAGAA